MTNPLLPPIPEGLKVLRNAHGYNHYFTHLQMDAYGRACADAVTAQPDCRTCSYHMLDRDELDVCYHAQDCTNGDQYQEATKVVLWRTE